MTTYRLRPGVRWVVERFSVTVTDGCGAARTLGYPEAAVWDLVSRGYAFSKVVALITHIAARDPHAAERLVRTAVEEWADSGFVLRDTSGAHPAQEATDQEPPPAASAAATGQPVVMWARTVS